MLVRPMESVKLYIFRIGIFHVTVVTVYISRVECFHDSLIVPTLKPVCWRYRYLKT